MGDLLMEVVARRGSSVRGGARKESSSREELGGAGWSILERLAPGVHGARMGRSASTTGTHLSSTRQAASATLDEALIRRLLEELAAEAQRFRFEVAPNP